MFDVSKTFNTSWSVDIGVGSNSVKVSNAQNPTIKFNGTNFLAWSKSRGGSQRCRNRSYSDGNQFGGMSGVQNRLMCEHCGRSCHTKNTC